EAPRTRSGAQAERRKGAGQKQRLQQKGGFGIASKSNRENKEFSSREVATLVESLKSNISTIAEDVVSVKEDVAILKHDMVEVKSDVAIIKDAIRVTLPSLDKRLTRVESQQGV
ncbi:MAG: hypothetical protein HYY14_05870, partial [Candidatus Omnitrophica bacterium]|nr:hypothetical protein [Candidatus Omnitrophota bacterium]